MHTEDQFQKLTNYTQDKSLFGKNSPQILSKFILYSRLCSDPLNIFAYMEEKSICIFLAHFWLAYANLYAQMGNFKNAFLCMKQAYERKDIQSENQIDFEAELKMLKNRMVIIMKRKPSKRKAAEYEFMYEEDTNKDLWITLDESVKLYTEKYSQAQRQAEKLFNLKMEGKKKSWLAPIQEEKEEKIKQIEEQISHSKGGTFMSLRTPLSKREPLRFTKTMDSVQIMKKRKSHQKETQNSDSDFENQNEEERIANCNTTPVGRDLASLKRRVTFNADGMNIEKIRKEKDVDEGFKFSSKSKKLEKRPSILRNSHHEKSNENSI